MYTNKNEITQRTNPYRGKNDYVYDDNGRMVMSNNFQDGNKEGYSTSFGGSHPYFDFDIDYQIYPGRFLISHPIYFEYDGRKDLFNGKL